jgi:hypothetical protein
LVNKVLFNNLVPDKEKGFAEPRVAGQAIIADPALFMYKYLNENTNYGRKHIFCNNCINLFFL